MSEDTSIATRCEVERPANTEQTATLPVLGAMLGRVLS